MCPGVQCPFHISESLYASISYVLDESTNILTCPLDLPCRKQPHANQYLNPIYQPNLN